MSWTTCSEMTPTREQQLVRQGWEKRTTYDEPRLSEMAELYAQLGFEVHLEPFDPTDQPGCAECLLQQPQRYKTLYTRKRIDPAEGLRS